MRSVQAFCQLERQMCVIQGRMASDIVASAWLACNLSKLNASPANLAHHRCCTLSCRESQDKAQELIMAILQVLPPT